MNIIIPIGSIVDSSFDQQDYPTSIKPLIRFLGKPMIHWIIDSLQPNAEDIVYLVYNHKLKKFNFEQQIRDYLSKPKNSLSNLAKKNKLRLNQIRFLELFYQTENVIETIYLASQMIEEPDRPLISIDSDSVHFADVIGEFRKLIDQPNNPNQTSNQASNLNLIYYFLSDPEQEPIYSYLKIDPQTNQLLKISEKKKLEFNQKPEPASTGCYCFSSGTLLFEYVQKLFDLIPHENSINPFYLSSVIKLMINHGERFQTQKLSTPDEYFCLGDSHSLKINSTHPILKAKAKKHRFCFDLDHTLVQAQIDPETKKVNYQLTKPITRNIEFLNFLKRQGHTIIIYTARRMRTHSGNVGKLVADIGPITFATLEKYKINYDEIHFGKPYADYYIDDLAINAYSDLEKELGFYQLFIPERAKHQLTISDQTVIKQSHSAEPTGQLAGEIHWYRNIPPNIQDLFPRLISYQPDLNQYTMEKISGITLSHLYLNQNLTPQFLLSFLQQIERIHQSQAPSSELTLNLDLNSNYLPKIKERYKEFFATLEEFSEKYPDHQEIYRELCEYFQDYQGEISVIHGDPVFTNVILTKMMKFKFIDMRGKLGDQLTIYGDRFYDFAKIYQSLIGYDSILLDEPVNQQYQKQLIETFEQYFQDQPSTLEKIRRITQSLLLTLLPLHHNHKCQSYFKLISSPYLRTTN